MKILDVLLLIVGGALMLHGADSMGGSGSPDLVEKSCLLGGGAELLLGLCRVFVRASSPW